jgi:hypothetical protein
MKRQSMVLNSNRISSHRNTISFISNDNSFLSHTRVSVLLNPGTSMFPQSSTEITSNYWPAEDTPPFLRGTVPFYQHLLGPPERLNIDSENFARHLTWNTSLSCSDGSYDKQYGTGTHGWFFSTDKRTYYSKVQGQQMDIPGSTPRTDPNLADFWQSYTSQNVYANFRESYQAS